MDSRATELRWVGGMFVLLAGLFLIWPELDLAVSGLFYRDGNWLLNRDSTWLLLPYRGVPRLGQAVILGLLLALGLSVFSRFATWRAKRPVLLFLLCGALLGPVLVVDIGIKDHSGRARPINVQPFGGDKVFSGAFIPTNQCRKNCAFVSGHVAMASFVMAFGWLSAPAIRRRYLYASLGTASAMALARMLPGGHFLSDALFAWFAVYFSLSLLEWVWRRSVLAKWPIPLARDECPMP